VDEGFVQGHLGLEARVALRSLPLVFGVEELSEPGAVRAAAEAGMAARAEEQLGDRDLERAGDRVGARGSPADTKVRRK
jgi:hypothetical protein